MKRRHLWLVALSLILSVCMCLALAGCNSCGEKSNKPVPLTAPEVTLTENGVEWNEVPHASGYAYKVNDGEAQPTTDTSVNLTNGDKIVVQAVGDGVNYSNSAWSEEVTFTKTPSGPVDLPLPVIEVDSATGIATWVWNPNANGYVYRINGGAEQTAENNSVQLAVGQYVEVKAIGDGVNYNSTGWSAKAYYEATVENPATVDAPSVTVEIDGTVKLFSANAFGFKVKIDGGDATDVTEELVEGQVVLTTKLTNGQSVSAQAQGNGTTYLTNENWSDTITYKAPVGNLSAPENIAIAVEGTEAGKVVVSWDTVTGANGYKYAVNDGTFVDVEATTVTVSLAEGQKVKVMAVGSSTATAPGDYSACSGDSEPAESEAFAIDNEKTYSVAEIVPVINYYGTTAATKNFTVTGVVVSNAAYSTQHGNIDIVIADNKEDEVTIKLFRATFAAGVGNTSVTENALVGFTVVCEGKPVVFNGTTLEFDAGCVVKELVADESGMSNADRVNFALAQLSLPNPEISNTNYMFQLPATGEYDTAVSWSFEALEDADTYEGNVLNVLRRAADADFTLTATVSYGEGEEKVEQTKSFPIVIFSNDGFNTHAEFLAAANNDVVKVKGVITGIAGTNIYFEDSDGGYYVYKHAALLGELEVGKTVIAKGTIEVYKGLVEIKDATVHVLDNESNPVVATDITEAFKAASAMNDKALLDLQSSLVTIKGATLIKEGTKYYVSIDNNKVELFFDGSTPVLESDALNAIKAEFDANVNRKADVAGFVGVYNNNIQLVPAADCLAIDETSKVALPDVVIEINRNTGVVSWAKDSNASGYAYQLKDTKVEESDWSEDLTDGITETDNVVSVKIEDGYAIRVKALGGETYDDSKWSNTVQFDKPADGNLIASVNIPDYAAKNNWEHNNTYQTVILDSVITATAEGGSSSSSNEAGKYNATNKDWRFYESGDNTLTLSAASDYTIVSVKLTFGNSNDGVAVVGTDKYNSGAEITVNNDSVTFTVGQKDGSSSTKHPQVLITEIEVVYKMKAIPLDAPELHVSGKTVTWDAVENASGYFYSVNDGTPVEVAVDGTLSASINNGETLKVWAVGDGTVYADSEQAVVTMLAVPSVSVIANEASWAAVDGATKYVYQTKQGAEGTWSAETEIDARRVVLEDGQYIQVKAVGDGDRYYNSDFCTPVLYTAPKEAVQIDDLDVTVTIDGRVTISSAKADSFEYTIAGGEKKSVDNTEDGSVVLPEAENLENGQSIVVKAIGDGTFYTDSEEVSVTFKKPLTYEAPALDTFSFEMDSANEGYALITWTAPELADGDTTYTVIFDEQSFTANSDARYSFEFKKYTSIKVKVNANGVTQGNGPDYSVIIYASEEIDVTEKFQEFYEANKPDVTEEEFDYTTEPKTSAVGEYVTITLASGGGTTPAFNTAGENRLYVKNTITVKATGSKTIAQIVLTYALSSTSNSLQCPTDGTSDTTGTGTGSHVTTWSGSSTEVVFTSVTTGSGGHIKLHSIKVVYEAPLDDQGKVDRVAAELTADDFDEPVSDDEMYLWKLPATDTLDFGTEIKWAVVSGLEGDDELEEDGTLTVYRRDEDAEVVIKATVTLNDATAPTADITLIIPKKVAPLDDQGMVDKVAAELTADDFDEPVSDDEMYMLALPATDSSEFGTEIKWAVVSGLEGDDELAEDGTLTVYRRDEDAEVVIKATVTLNDATATSEDITLIIPKKGEEPPTPPSNDPDTESVTIADLGWTNGANYKTLKIGNVTATASDKGNTGNTANSAKEWRFYASDSPNGSITFTADEGYIIISVTITYTSGGATFVGAASDTAVEVNDTTVTFETTGSKNAGITAISVTYQKVS